MENGDKIDIGKLKPQAVGTEMTYEIIGEGQPYNKAKAVSPMHLNGGGQGHSPLTPSNAVKTQDIQAMIIKQVCIKASCEYHAGRNTSTEDVIADAKMFEEYITEKPKEVVTNGSVETGMGMADKSDMPF